MLWPAFAVLLCGGATAVTDFSVTTSKLSVWNQTDWSLTTKTYIPGQYQSRMSLANGYVGASVAAAGPFFELDVNQTDPNGIPITNGWPLFSPRLSFSTISGFYNIQPNGTGTNYPWLNQYGYESFISGIPHPTGIIFSFGGNYLDATTSNNTISDFNSSISFKTGVASWNYRWSPAGCTAHFDIGYNIFFSRVRPNVIAVQATILASSSIRGTVTDLLDGRSAMRSYLESKGLIEHRNAIYSAVHPNDLANITAYVFSTADFDKEVTDLSSRKLAEGEYVSLNESTIGQSFNISLKAGEKATFTKYIGVASSDKFADAKTVAHDASKNADDEGWYELLREHSEAWAKLLAENTVDDFTDPVTGSLPDNEDVQILHVASIANTFYLLQNLQPDGSGLNDNSISVGGLASDSYAGLIFWDADYWMAPGLNLAFPSYSKQISNYRVKLHPQALANAAFNGYEKGASLYSWTSGRYGNCTGTGPCVDYEYHLNYDIANNIRQQKNITQNVTWFNNGPRQVVESTALMTSELLKYNVTTQTYWLHNATDPDEYANNVDNPAFTIASAADLLVYANSLLCEEGLPEDVGWTLQANNIQFPRAASNITLEYQTMNNSVEVKQADVVLLTYPLDFGENGYSIGDKQLDLDFYSNRQSPNGPGMTYSIFAVDANALSTSGCSAYTYTLGGFLPYLRAPWYQFSEQANDDFATNGGTNPAFPFLTGHGGANQVVPFGFLGIRTDQDVLYINPSLPPQISHVRIRRFYYAGAGLLASMNQTHTILTRFDTSNVTSIIDKYKSIDMPIRVGNPGTNNYTAYELGIGDTIVIPNRRYFTSLTYAKNVLQCLPVSSSDAYVPGQFPVAATDGSTATRWQPAVSNKSSITVNMTGVPYQPITGAYFDWGTRPPLKVTINISNSSTGLASVLTNDAITLDEPFNATATALEVMPYIGNSTTWNFGSLSWTGDYVQLEIEGCYEDDGVGATVGEFVLIAR